MRRPLWIAALFHLGLAAVVLAPSLGSPVTTVIGAPGSDVLKHVWGEWWAWWVISTQGRVPLETRLICFPSGGHFFSLGTAQALLTAPLRLVADAPLVYNIGLLLQLWLAGLGAWVLARTVGARPGPALLAGAVLQTSPWLLSFGLGSGVTETAFLFPLPLIAAGFVRTLRGPGTWAPISTGLLLLLQGLGCWSHGIMAGNGIVLGTAAWLATRPWRLHPGQAWALDRPAVVRLCVLGAVAVLPGLLLYTLVQGTVAGDGAVYARVTEVFPSHSPVLALHSTHNSLGLADLFMPGPGSLHHNSTGPDRLMYTGYLGATPLVLALLALRRRDRSVMITLLLTVSSLVLSFGPHLGRWGSSGWPNPAYLALYHALPLFNTTIHNPSRFILGAQLGLGVLAALGLGQGGLRAGLAAAVAVTLESLLVSPCPWPLPTSPATAKPSSLALTEPGAVIDLPFREGRSDRFVSDIFLQQTFHHRAVPYRLDGAGLTVVSPELAQNRWFRSVVEVLEQDSPRPPADCGAARALRAMGFGTVIFHPGRAAEHAAIAVEKGLDNCLGEGRRVGDAVLYSLPRPPHLHSADPPPADTELSDEAQPR